MTAGEELHDIWDSHSAEWRNPSQICSQWHDAARFEPRLLESKSTGKWWSILEHLRLTLLVTREYEHLVMALSAPGGRPRESFFAVPHPSGLVVDRANNRIFLASTRNPNQIYLLKPAATESNRPNMNIKPMTNGTLIPVSSAFYPGSLYVHDLALIGSKLYANAVGHNAVAEMQMNGEFERVWWPKCVETKNRPVFSQNFIQLNSIAAGKTLKASFFSASSCSMGRARPGHLNYPVDGRGVIFSGLSREPICTGLTRPHSARLREKEVWVANSGYGEIGFVSGNRLEVVARLPGWTRGLCIVDDVAFAGTSRVLPKYARYAPGLDVTTSRCAVHAISCKTGELLGSIEWPMGNQLFAIDWISDRQTPGFPFETKVRNHKQVIGLFYNYVTD